MLIFKLDIEGMTEFPSPMTVIKELSTSLKTFEVKITSIEDITRKMRRIMVVEGVPPKKPRTETIQVRFRVSSDLERLKKDFPDGKHLGQVDLDSGVTIHVYREQK